MACITLIAQPFAMATTRLARAVPCDSACLEQPEISVERTPLRMSWVVTTDSDGNRQLRRPWAPAADR